MTPRMIATLTVALVALIGAFTVLFTGDKSAAKELTMLAIGFLIPSPVERR